MAMAVPAFLCGGMQQAASQNLDPTVEVSRTYVAKKMEVGKSALRMAVPDSVMKFDLDFDYSVNDNPYRGAYEFRPYVLDMRPESQSLDGNTFFLRAGAGYSLHPTLDLVYSPKFGKVPFAMGIYGTHRSYVGNYRGVRVERKMQGLPDEVLQCDVMDGESYRGYNSYTSAGVEGRTDWKTGYFSFDIGYTGYADKDTMRTRGYDAVRADFRIASNRTGERYFFYDVAASYRFGEDKIELDDKPDYYDDYGNKRRGFELRQYVAEHDFSLKATLGPVFTQRQRFVMDVFTDIAAYGSSMDSFVGRFGITPRYQLRTGRWNFDLGVKISALFRENRLEEPYLLNTTRGQYVYPDLEIGFNAIRDYMNIYLKVDGGDDINRYSDMIARNWHFSKFYDSGYMYDANYPVPLLDNTVERVKAVLGFRGNVASRLSYSLSGGYACYKNMMFDSALASPYLVIGEGLAHAVFLSPVSTGRAGYSPCNMYFAGLDLEWRSRDVSADVSLRYCSTDLEKREAKLFAPSPFTADANIVYNWKRRIYAGVHCNAALAREGRLAFYDNDNIVTYAARIPGYADLGVSLEYRVNRKFSVWLYGGNLLNMTIQRVPLYAEGGISATGGITLSL